MLVTAVTSSVLERYHLGVSGLSCSVLNQGQQDFVSHTGGCYPYHPLSQTFRISPKASKDQAYTHACVVVTARCEIKWQYAVYGLSWQNHRCLIMSLPSDFILPVFCLNSRCILSFDFDLWKDELPWVVVLCSPTSVLPGSHACWLTPVTSHWKLMRSWKFITLIFGNVRERGDLKECV